MVSLRTGIFLVLLCCEGLSALQWVNQSPGQARIQTCEGSTITFPWIFNLDPDEDVEDIKWLYTPTAGSADLMVANYVYGHFIPVSPYDNRVNHLGNGTIELSQVSRKDSGQYEIEVAVRQGSQFLTERQSAVLEVGEPPSQDHLTAYLTSKAVYDNSTNQFHLQLACGRLSAVGQPPVSVVWTLPSGAEVGSSYSDSGTYFLLVPNPIKGGNYRCRVAPPSSALSCMTSNMTLMNASVELDSTAARLTLLEAKGDALMAENNKLKKELNETSSTLINQNNQLKADNSQALDLSNQLKLELRLTENLVNELRDELGVLKTHLNNTDSTLQSRLDDLSNKLQGCQGKMSNHVSFHARLTPVRAHVHAHVVFDDVLTNEGAAYDPATGEFTAPVNGTYFFAFTASPHSLRHYSNCELKVDNRPVANIKTKYTDDYFNMATGHAVLRLDQGQIVTVNPDSTGMGLGGLSSESFQPELSFFSGFLVSPGC